MGDKPRGGWAGGGAATALAALAGAIGGGVLVAMFMKGIADEAASSEGLGASSARSRDSRRSGGHADGSPSS